MDKQEIKDENIRANLTEELNLVESALSNSYKNLQLVTNSSLIDYYTYQIKADEAKHKYLLDKIKDIAN